MTSKNTSALVGGIAGGLLATVLVLPQITALETVACLGYVGCGLLAVWHYTKENTLTIKAGQGVGLGALAGVYGGLIASSLSWFFRAMGVLPGAEEAIQQLEEAGALDSGGGDFAVWLIEFSMGIGGVLLAVAMGAVLALIGGAIGAAVFKKGAEEILDN